MNERKRLAARFFESGRGRVPVREWLLSLSPDDPKVIGDAPNARIVMLDDVEKGRVGPSFEDFLKDEGVYQETTERAVKRVIAFQLVKAMEDQAISKVEMARRLNTSRSQLNRLLDPENMGVTLEALSRAARAVGREIRLELQ